LPGRDAAGAGLRRLPRGAGGAQRPAGARRGGPARRRARGHQLREPHPALLRRARPQLRAGADQRRRRDRPAAGRGRRHRRRGRHWLHAAQQRPTRAGHAARHVGGADRQPRGAGGRRAGARRERLRHHPGVGAARPRQALPDGQRAQGRARRHPPHPAGHQRPHRRQRARRDRDRSGARRGGPARRRPGDRRAEGGRGRGHPRDGHREADAVSGAASTAPVGVTGRLTDLSAAQLARLLERGASPDPEVERATAAAIADVRARGDAALLDLARRYDAAVPQRLEVPREACRHALAELAPALRAALEEAAANGRAFHAAQLPDGLGVEVRPGVRLGRRPEPLARVGVYAPGGRASYPSSVLMGVVPARVAGVGEAVVCSPPGPDGLPPAAVLAACALAGADRVFAVGGGGAVAAMARGTQSVPRVDKVVGPGNAYVTETKRQLNGVVAIDCPAGPSEVLVVADATADPELVALELLAQAEHDPRAAAVLVSVGAEPARAVADALARLLPSQARREVSEASLRAAGALLVADDLEAALAFAARYAPEHLLLMLAEPRAALPRVRNAGTVFLGAS